MSVFARCKRVVFSAILLGIFGGTGCQKDRPFAPAEDRLIKLGNAFLAATQRLGRPPASVDDIKLELGADATDDFLRSPGDGEPFVIIWGIDYNAIPPRVGDPHTVAAYEKTGVNGKRYVLRFPRSVALMTDEQLVKASFPDGHAFSK